AGGDRGDTGEPHGQVPAGHPAVQRVTGPPTGGPPTGGPPAGRHRVARRPSPALSRPLPPAVPSAPAPPRPSALPRRPRPAVSLSCGGSALFPARLTLSASQHTVSQ